MLFKNRTEAGKLLAKRLVQYTDQPLVVFALPRGGVITAKEIAQALHAPLDLIITRKIGHPLEPEFAIAATDEQGDLVMSSQLSKIDKEWFENAIAREQKEAKRRREKYLQGKPSPPVKGKIAILVDDGVATGLTLLLGIAILKKKHPKKIVVAVPVISESIASIIQKKADELIALSIPPEREFLGAVGAYYMVFSPVTDRQVTDTLMSLDVTSLL